MRVAALLAAGLALALATPAWVAYASPDLAGYLLHPALFLMLSVPYVLCGALWLPWRAPRLRKPAIVLAMLLLTATVIIDVPILLAGGTRGGDMIALAYVAIAAGLTIGVLLASAAAVIAIQWGSRRSS